MGHLWQLLMSLIFVTVVFVIPIASTVATLVGIATQSRRPARISDALWPIVAGALLAVIYLAFAEHNLGAGTSNGVILLGLLACVIVAVAMEILRFAWQQNGIRTRLSVVGMSGMMLLLTLMQPAYFAAREAARASQCKGNFGQLKHAMNSYLYSEGQLPEQSTGTPPHSWRIALLPHLDSKALFESYDFQSAWNAEENIPTAKLRRGIYTCPTMPLQQNDELKITGYSIPLSPQGLYQPDAPVREFENFPKGVSHTALLIEACGERIPWTEPRDVLIGASPTVLVLKNGRTQVMNTLSTYHPSGATVVTADGSVKRFAPETSPEILKAFFDASAPPETADSF